MIDLVYRFKIEEVKFELGVISQSDRFFLKLLSCDNALYTCQIITTNFVACEPNPLETH